MHSWLYCIGFAVAVVTGGLGAFALVAWLLTRLWLIVERRANSGWAAAVCIGGPIFLMFVILVALQCRGIVH